MSHQFTTPVSVWISQYGSHDADTLQTATDATGLVINDASTDWSSLGYTRVGFGEATITIASKVEILNGKVDTLRAELAKDRADSQVRQNALIRKISELEALTYEQPTTV